MQSAIQNISITAMVTAVLGLSLFGLLKGCENARTAYYEAQKNCIAAGGNWIPKGGDGGFQADCLRLK